MLLALCQFACFWWFLTEFEVLACVLLSQQTVNKVIPRHTLDPPVASFCRASVDVLYVHVCAAAVDRFPCVSHAASSGAP